MNRTWFETELGQIVPAERVLVGPAELVSFQSDGLTAFQAKPKAVVVVESDEEIIRTVQWCHHNNVPFVARGSGTSLSGGSLPNEKGIVIALNRMNRILKIDPVQRIATVQSGVINLDVSRAVEKHGLYYAPDPSSQQVCTIGGNVAFNSGGAHCLKYGMTSNHILGIKAVLPDGEIVELGGESQGVCGPDSVGLFVGSEGMFGIALEITLRLMPIPESVHTVMAGYETVEKAGEAVAHVIGSGVLPAAMEIMDRLAMDAANVAGAAAYPQKAEAMLIIELDGSRVQIHHEKVKLNQLIDDTHPCELVIAKNAEQRAAIWKGRKSSFSAVGRLSPDFIVQDSVVPRRYLAKALRAITELSEQYGIRVANVFHAGDGNLHPLILFDGSVDGELHRAEELAGKIVRLCIELGGSITGEHGVGMEKRQFLSEMFASNDIELMKRLRRSLDPHEIANEGKMFPDAEAPSLSMYGLHPLEKAGVISRE